MSNVIRDIEKLNSRQLETAKRRQNRELRNIDSAHDKMKVDLKKSQSEEMVDIRDTHHHQIATEAEKKERVLSDLRSNLQNTQAMTDKQLRDLKVNSDKEKAATSEKLVYDRERIIGENGLYLEELNDRFTQETKKVNYDGKNRVEDMKANIADQYSNVEGHNRNKLNEQTNQFTTRFQQDGMNYKKIKDHQDGQFKKERMSTNVKQQVQVGQMAEVHNQLVEKKDTEYRKDLKTQDLFFEDKYKVHLDKSNGDLKQLDDLHKKISSQMKTDLTQELTKVSEKSKDPFFQFASLKPTWKEVPEGIEVTVGVPEHSKQDVQLTINNKEAIVTMNRRYSDANRTPEGVINKVHKVESFVTRLPTSSILDPKGIKSTYDNGVMTYVIKKA